MYEYNYKKWCEQRNWAIESIVVSKKQISMQSTHDTCMVCQFSS